MTDWLRVIRAEYKEVPGLRLTKAQFRRLWNLDAQTCDVVLEILQADQFLRKTATGNYVRSDA